ncbi:MAG: type II toxin-antitoxin system VapC family toxin [Candidatus Latescibacteria bacterium]|nr:type II toxin-antitoxin system VapC family toxin [Candidatus Latescibacterota bacterium]
MRILLDTNGYSHLKRGHRRVATLVRGSEEIFLSIVVIGELLYGFRQGSRSDRNIAELQAFLNNPYVTSVPISFVTADHYAQIAMSLKAKGRPIPSNDIWIAAHAMETGAHLISSDRHFAEIDGISWMHVSNE